MTLGEVASFEGSYLIGWAIGAAGGVCSIEITDEKARLVGSGHVLRRPPDPGSHAIDRADFAFRIPVKNLGASRSLAVRADGVALPGSPVPTGAGIFDGQIAVTNGRARGWVTERKATFAAPTIRIIDQHDQPIASGPSTIDESNGDPLFAPARFDLKLPASCYGRPDLRLRALVGAREFASTACSLRLVGNLRGVSPDRVTGWLLSPDAPDMHFRLEIRRNGMLVGEGVCDIPRPDLRDKHPLMWQTGFDIKLSVPDEELARTSELSVRLPGSPSELFDGPFVVGRRPALIATARRVAQASHTGHLQLAADERSVLQAAMAAYAANARGGNEYVALRCVGRPAAQAEPRLTVLIPVYLGIEETQSCLRSVLQHRNPATDAVIIINDKSPDEGMAPMLRQFAHEPLVSIVSNETNRGFVQSVNRGLRMCRSGDVVLLNADTRMFKGGLAELWRVAHSAPDIGTVTAMSNNATIFSYPHPDAPAPSLKDASWKDLASVALRENAGLQIDVPTGHGFCMLIKRAVLEHIPALNEAFGRGYGEENELCLRAADLGYRHVAAAGVLVEHAEAVSFGDSKPALLETNLPKLEAMFPEYTATVMDFEKHDGLRRARWALDSFRLGRASAAGTRFALVVETWLGHGTQKAIDDMEAAVGYGGATKARLACTASGQLVLDVQEPRVRAVFAPEESARLFDMLAGLTVDLVVVHQLVGFSADFIERLAAYAEGRTSIYYVHDFYPICPRVTMIDAAGAYCGRAETDHCARCVEVGGVHEASRLGALAPAAHRELLARFLLRMQHIVAPSRDTAAHFVAVFPHLKVLAVPHPQSGTVFPSEPRTGDPTRIVLLGAIGPHKGSGRLLDLAKLARLTHPQLHFHVVGYTDVDAHLARLANVTVTGRYTAAELPARLAETGGSLALFLHEWPETFSYTLTEAVAAGLAPVVPDIGAPAERVREAGFGIVYPLPVDLRQLLETLDQVAKGRRKVAAKGSGPDSYCTADAAKVISRLVGMVSPATSAPASNRTKKRKVARTVRERAP